MKVAALYIHPVKSLNGISVQEAQLTPLGLKHDRVYMLTRAAQDGSHEHLIIGKDARLCLYDTAFEGADVVITSRTGVLRVPLQPDLARCRRIKLRMAEADIVAYDLGPEYSLYFQPILGPHVKLLFRGSNSRKVMINKPPSSPLSSIYRFFHEYRIAFADAAQLLVTSTASLEHLNAALPAAAEMRRFRPNIVVAGAQAPWDEDSWGVLGIRDGTGTGNRRQMISLTGGCPRCVSTTVDFSTGEFGMGGQPLKALQKDRRIDANYRYSPIFGRYGYGEGRGSVRVGDAVSVLKRNAGYTNLAKVDFKDVSPPCPM